MVLFSSYIFLNIKTEASTLGFLLETSGNFVLKGISVIAGIRTCEIVFVILFSSYITVIDIDGNIAKSSTSCKNLIRFHLLMIDFSLIKTLSIFSNLN